MNFGCLLGVLERLVGVYAYRLDRSKGEHFDLGWERFLKQENDEQKWYKYLYSTVFT